MSFLISIPVPPSCNNLFANRRDGRGRYKTKRYREWITEAGWMAKSQRPQRVAGKYKFFLSLPPIRGDASNRVKAAEDLIVSLGLVDDDRHCVNAQVAICDDLNGHAIVAVEAV